MTTIVIMPGGFHPFHAGHAALYQSAQRAFPDAEVFVAATNDTSTRPFPFAVKEKLAKLAGVAPGKFIQVTSPFKAKEVTDHFDPDQDVLIFVRSDKDATKPPQAGGNKKDGSPSYLQPLLGAKRLEPFSKHAYMAYLPTVEFGPGMTSATEIRTAWPTLNEKRKTALVMSLYPKTQTNPKLASTVVKMLDAAIGSQEVAEGSLNEFAPGAGDDGDEDPYKYPKPEQYRRSADFFGKFEADHFDREDFDDATGVFKGYWGRTPIAYFKFSNPAKTGSDDPGMGWYYEPESSASNDNTSARPAAFGNAEQRKQQELSMIDAFLKSGNRPNPDSQIGQLMKKHGMMEGVAEGSEAPPKHHTARVSYHKEGDPHRRYEAIFKTTHNGGKEETEKRAKAAFSAKKKIVYDIVHEQGVAEGAPFVVPLAPIHIRNPKKAPQPFRNQGDIVPPTKPPSTEKRGVKGRPGQRPMPKYDEGLDENQGWAATYETNAQNFVGGMKAGYQARENQPVAEQDQDYIEEKWSAKYKSSINCAAPKGFSQKAHCAGRKK